MEGKMVETKVAEGKLVEYLRTAIVEGKGQKRKEVVPS
jgi:hypothetical protein